MRRILLRFMAAILMAFSTVSIVAYAQQTVIAGNNSNGEEYSYFYDVENKNPILLDTVLLRINYLKNFVVDTIENTRVQEMSTLELGRKISKFYNRQYFMADSLLQVGPSAEAVRLLYENISYPLTFFETFYQNYPAGKLTVSGRILTQYLLYEEDMPKIDWTLRDSTKELLGITCFQAVCSFRGRDYTAWYTPEIPSMSGPWKFSGLPGLILEVYDSRNEYRFTAHSIYRTGCRIYMPDKDYLKTNRRKFEQAQRLLIEHPTAANSLYMGNSAWKALTLKVMNFIMRYNFLETE